MLRTASTVVVLTLLGAGVAASQAPATPRPFSYRFDLRQPVEDSDKLGLDFELQYTRSTERTGLGNFRGWNYDVTGVAKGYQDFEGEATELDFMAAEGRLEGQYYASRLTAAEGAIMNRLIDIDDDDLTEAQRDSLQRLLRKQSEGPRFFVVDGHYRMETTQDVDGRQHVLGLGLAGEVPALHRPLGLLAEMLGGPSATQPIRAYLGFDYVGDGTGVEVEGRSVDEAYPRARFEAAWGARIANDLRIRATWQVHYLHDPPAAIAAADRDLNSFFEAWVVVPLGAVVPGSQSTGLLVKYADGHLPPNYSQTSTARLGFTISLQ